MLKIWSCFRKPTTLDKHVIIFGQHSDDWMSALHPDAIVWKHLPEVKSLELISSTSEIPKTSKRRASNTVIIPLMESHLYEMATNLKSLTSTPELVSLMADKLRLTEELIANGFAQYVPKTWANSFDSIFPCVIKRRDLSGGEGIQILKSIQELSAVLSDTEFSGKQYYFQDFVSGDVEYVCHIVALKGEILYSNYFECAMPGPEMVRGWDSPITITNRGSNLNNEVSVAFRNIVKYLGYSGPCNIDFKLTNGLPKIFEINPRLGGSLMVSENLPVLIQILNIIIREAS
jgi:carbamoylphosphate synthase large subunit